MTSRALGMTALLCLAAVGCRGGSNEVAASTPAVPDAAPTLSTVSDPAPVPVADPVPEEPIDENADTRFAEAMMGHRNKVSTADLSSIKREKVLRVITRNNSTGYFLYRGVEAGFDFDVARMLARELDVRLEMVVPPTRRDLIPYLLDGKGDVIIAGLPTDSERADRVAFSRPYLETPWVVVVRRADAGAIRELKDLSGKTVLASGSSGALRRLRALSTEQGVTWQIRAAVETLESEDMIDLVADGEVHAAVIEKRIADVELMHRPELALGPTLPGEPERAAFAVRHENPELLAAVEAFLKKHHRGTEWNLAYRRYHEGAERTAEMRETEARADRQGALTPWDDEFKAAARTAGLDWRLLAAQAYQESHFDPKVRSPMGALGLMQMMPAVARAYGVTRPMDPLDSLKGGARYMKKLVDSYAAPGIKLKDQVRFALAAYNAGPGHLEDARTLARTQRLDPNRWFDNVARAMLLLSKPRYFRKSRYGYVRGEEPVKYVSEIQSRYDAYVALTENRPGREVAAE
ncbi:MAG: transporter substrate-binding domain-containing protein [Myxococcota bacterium]